jgi:hypothetical protein
MVARRAAVIGVALTVTAAIAVWALGHAAAAVVLTATAAVGIINGLWLEGALARVLQPGRPRFSLSAVLQLAGRWALWAVLFGVLVSLKRYVDVWAVALGVGCYVIALASAGLSEGAGEGPAERQG